MSRIGNKPIPLPKGVKVELDGSHLMVQGPQGHAGADLPPRGKDRVQRKGRSW